MLKKVYAGVALILVLVVLVAVSFRRPPPGGPAIVEGTVRLTIGLPKEPLSALCHIAVAKGFLRAEGIEATVVDNYASGKVALQGLLAGEVEVTSSAEVPIVFNSFGSEDFKVVATIGSSNNEPKVIARKDAGIEAPGDLKGKRVATQRASAVHFFLHLFMLKHALSEEGVKLSYLKGSELPAALAEGQIDAFSMREPFISQARELVGEENAVLFAEPGLYLKTFNLVATGALIRGGSQTVDRVLRALVRAERFATAHPKECVRIVATRLGLAESDIESVWPEIDLRVTLDQALLRGLEDEAQWAIKNDLVEAEEPPNYLDFIYLDGLKRVRPESISIIH